MLTGQATGEAGSSCFLFCLPVFSVGREGVVVFFFFLGGGASLVCKALLFVLLKMCFVIMLCGFFFVDVSMVVSGFSRGFYMIFVPMI